MSKTKDEAVEQVQQQSYIDELLAKGTAVLKAKSREELSEMVNEIPANCKYAAGAVGRSKEDGTFSLRVDVIQ